MRPDVARDLSGSADAFIRLVVPKLVELYGGRFESSEHVAAEGFARDLDVLAGIDAWHTSAEGMRGVASRVQFTDQSWDTFTIRYRRASGAETEYAKRLRAIERACDGWLLPHLTVQAYVSPCRRRLVSLGVVETALLYETATRGLATDDKRAAFVQTNPADGNEFLVIPWTALGSAIRQWRPSPVVVSHAQRYIPKTLGRVVRGRQRSRESPDTRGSSG